MNHYKRSKTMNKADEEKALNRVKYVDLLYSPAKDEYYKE